MSSAKRRINSTGRKRIGRDHIDIRMLETAPGESLKATASVDVKDFDFPDNAAIAIEAYHKSSGMRFDCGTVGAPSIPPVLDLDEVDHSGNVLFRVKVIDREQLIGRLLGAAERIQPRSEDDAEGRRSIFPVIQRDLVDLPWKVEVDDDAPPVLILNSRIPGFKQRILENPLLQGILLPEALRIVLDFLVANSADDEEDEDSGWKGEWLKYCEEELAVARDPSDMTKDERDDWVDEVCIRFCEKCDFVGSIRAMMRDGKLT